MAKESLFNILANRFDFSAIKVLDLFSGTGSISFEFASRGCMEITLIENDFIHFKSIIQNIEKIGIKNAITPVKADVYKFLNSSMSSFDLVFADPPYTSNQLYNLPELIINSKVLIKGGTLILEHSGKYNFDKLNCFREVRSYGSVYFTFFEKE